LVSDIILSAYAWVTSRWALLKEEHGQDILEYAVIAGAIALIFAGILFAFDWDTPFEDFYDNISACIEFDSDNCGI
jgi:hypothetical protein